MEALTLQIGPHVALVHAVGLRPPPPTWDLDDEGTWRIVGLLVIARREAASLIRHSLDEMWERSPDMAIGFKGGKELPVTWDLHLRGHSFSLSRPLGGAVHLLLAPACSQLDRIHDCPDPWRLVMGRTQEGLLHNAFLRLVTLSRFPIHPSWEGPIMAHLAAAGERGENCGLTFLRSHGVLQFAYLDYRRAEGEVERLWHDGRLPVPPAPA